MTPAALQQIMARVLGNKTSARTIARALIDAGVDTRLSADGREIRRMLAGQTEIPRDIAETARALARHADTPSGLERMLVAVRANAPRASIMYAQLLLHLQRHRGRSVALVDLCETYGSDRNDSAVNHAVRRLAEIGLVNIDRGTSARHGHQVRLCNGN